MRVLIPPPCNNQVVKRINGWRDFRARCKHKYARRGYDGQSNRFGDYYVLA